MSCSIQSLQRAIEKCERRIQRAKNKARFSESRKDKDAAFDEIEKQESLSTQLKQKLAFRGIFDCSGDD